jgi:hypothetical protein
MSVVGDAWRLQSGKDDPSLLTFKQRHSSYSTTPATYAAPYTQSLYVLKGCCRVAAIARDYGLNDRSSTPGSVKNVRFSI